MISLSLAAPTNKPVNLRNESVKNLTKTTSQVPSFAPMCNARYLPPEAFPKSSRTNCTMYGSRRFTYHQGDFSTLVREHVSAWKNAEVEPSIAFWGIPEPSVEICMGAFPAATFRTVNKNDGGEVFGQQF